MPMVYCSKCGKLVSSRAGSCCRCGKPLADSEELRQSELKRARKDKLAEAAIIIFMIMVITALILLPNIAS